MELAPRYCRSCGSRILIKNVCHTCNNDPLKGENYCYDCGALTPNADGCLNCGARYKKKLNLKPILIAGGFLIISIAVVGYFLSRPATSLENTSSEKTSVQTPVIADTNKLELQQTTNTVINNPVDTSTLIARKPLVTSKPSDTLVSKKVTPDSIKKITPNINIISSGEINAYNARCTYFTKNQRSQVLFFIAGGSGYIKVNGKIIQLQRKRKGVDSAVFGNDEYEATISIDGLSGSEKEWLAACTLIIKDALHNTIKHKVYSSCIEL